MNRIHTLGLAALLTVAAAAPAAAQWNVARFAPDHNRAYTTFGFNPALVPAVGFGRVLRLADHNFQVAADIGVVAADFDTHDFRAQLGTQTSIVHWKAVHLAGSAKFITRGTQNLIYTGLNCGADFTGALGVYKNKWFTAGEFGFDKAIVTHITHSDWYRTYYYAGAKDGWYMTTGGTWHFGLAGGFALGTTELTGSFGWRTTEDFNLVMPPMYASVGVGFGF